MSTKIFRAMAGILIACFQYSSVTAAHWAIYDIGTLGGQRSSAHDINDSGQVIGWAQTAAGQERAFVYDAINGMASIPMPADAVPHGSSRGWRINALGDVVGSYSSTAAGGNDRAFVFSNGITTSIPTLGGVDNVGLGINDLGAVVGASWTSEGNQRGFLYSSDTLTALGSLGGNSVAYDINNAGRIVGYSSNGGNSRAVEFIGGSPIDLALPAGDFVALAINNSGSIAGEGRGAFIIANGVATFPFDAISSSISALSWASRFLDINDGGQAVGYAYDSQTVPRAYLFSGGEFTDLSNLPEVQASGWTNLYLAAGINDAGAIVGTGMRNGVEHGFLLTPIPVPSGIWLLLAALMPMLGALRTRTGRLLRVHSLPKVHG